ncbi:MAG: pyridoxamine 5'-phosphate oxidase family protein [Pseudomonadales bacterium]|jgi:hypothetical protein|nr:pyridoxamine 5'-phosphate oxidase family protein [Pseudomonadales bacterium]MDP6469816.1 pyridoxamine 5'-phosphate oxidase family protein [Pseudomonadales bacterium]MDP6827582.1 pyridoxamine 5'-phosphate oxidase family protein [Pseudomonadales bacterium]MDP6971286.1 pyridoxamine 5'-phosphate oxidase family protein [Pseudomonadales bacterium]|tara:strand:+ start:869 stop:1483 length:615 start_codon:yes stop_codon:yes gene_type:complete
MQDLKASELVTSEAELGALYGLPPERALTKEIDHINTPYRAFIERSPFVIVASAGPEGLDCSPRGDPAGVVRVADGRTLLLPDRRGNNRLDTLRNIVRDGRISLLFLIPGIGESMRVNGRAAISIDKDLRQVLELEGKVPTSVIVVHVQRAYFQCQKALARSRLWEDSTQASRDEVPTAGTMLNAIDADFDGANYPRHLQQTIY